MFGSCARRGTGGDPSPPKDRAAAVATSVWLLLLDQTERLLQRSAVTVPEQDEREYRRGQRIAKVLSASTEIALVLEGVILLGVRFAASTLRRRVGRPDDGPPTGSVQPLVAAGDSSSESAGAGAPQPDATVDFGA